MFWIETTDLEKLSSMVETCINPIVNKVEAESLSRKIAKEVLSRTFKDEKEFEDFIYKRAFEDPMQAEFKRLDRIVKRLKKYVLTGWKPKRVSDWEEMEVFIEDASSYRYEDENDLEFYLSNLVYDFYAEMAELEEQYLYEGMDSEENEK